MTSEILDWHKSSYSNNTGGMCVEVAETTRGAALRDSRHPEAAMLAFDAAEWRAFVAEIKSGGLR